MGRLCVVWKNEVQVVGATLSEVINSQFSPVKTSPVGVLSATMCSCFMRFSGRRRCSIASVIGGSTCTVHESSLVRELASATSTSASSSCQSINQHQTALWAVIWAVLVIIVLGSKVTLQKTESRKTAGCVRSLKQFRLQSLPKSLQRLRRCYRWWKTFRRVQRRLERSGRQWSCATLVPASMLIEVFSEG